MLSALQKLNESCCGSFLRDEFTLEKGFRREIKPHQNIHDLAYTIFSIFSNKKDNAFTSCGFRVGAIFKVHDFTVTLSEIQDQSRVLQTKKIIKSYTWIWLRFPFSLATYSETRVLSMCGYVANEANESTRVKMLSEKKITQCDNKKKVQI